MRCVSARADESGDVTRTEGLEEGVGLVYAETRAVQAWRTARTKT